MQSSSNEKESLSTSQLEANLHAEELAIEEQAARLRKEAEIKSMEEKPTPTPEESGQDRPAAKEVPAMPIVDSQDNKAEADRQDSKSTPDETPSQQPGHSQQSRTRESSTSTAENMELTPAPVVREHYVQTAVSSQIEQELASIRRRTGSMALLFFLFLIAIGAGIFYAVAHPDKFAFLQPQPQVQAPAIDPVRLAQAYTDIDRLKDELGTVRELNSANQQLRSAVGALTTEFTNYKNAQSENTNRLRSLSEKLRSYELRDPDDWRIAQAYFLSNNAFLMAVLNHDAKSAIWCLKDADNLLVNLEDESILRIRAAINRDVLSLSSLPDIDIRGIIFKLDSIYNNIPKMALNDLSSEEERQALLQKKQAVDGNIANWKDNLLASLSDFSSRFVEVRRRTDPMVNEFLSPKQANILQQNVQSEILMAKFSVINQNDQAFTNNLAQAIKLIEQYYDQNTDAYKANISALNELKGMRVSTNAPTALQSYALFKEYADEKFKFNTKAEVKAAPPKPAAAPAAAPAPAVVVNNPPAANHKAGAK